MNIVTLLIIELVLSLIIGFLGRHKKFGFWGYFFASLLFTPLVGLLLVLASDPRVSNPRVSCDSEKE
jgi:hypothetical protein